MKKIAIGITSILSVSCLMGAVLSLNSATANASEANLYMVDGASVRLSAVKSGIGFTTRVNYDYYNTLDETYDVVTGTLILPTDYLTANEITMVTHETLTAKGEAGVFFQDIVNQGWKNTATASKDGYYEYRGSLVNLNKGNYDREFSAVGYIGYKTAEADTYTYEYTEYDVANNSRAIDDVAFNAFVDRTQTEQTVDGVEYKYEVSKDSTYSRYTGDELGILKGYMRTTAVTANGTTIIQDEDGTLELNALKTVASENSFEADSIVGGTRNEKTVSLTDTGLDVSLNGIYNVTLSGETAYTNGAIIPATLTASVDVWSEATKNVMIAAYDYSFVGGYTGQNTTVEKYTVGTYTVDGKEGTYYMLDVEGAVPAKKTTLDAGVLIGKPLHSVQYYEQWLASNPYVQSYISMEFYFDNSKDPETNNLSDSPLYSIFNGFTKGAGSRNVWHGGKIELNEFLTSHYDNLSSYYDTVGDEMDAVFAGEISRFERFFDAYGVKTATGELVYGYLMTTKLQSRMNNGYITPMTLEFGKMKTIQTTELVDRNSESSITPSLTAEEQAVIDYWNNQGYTISYEFVKRYSDGTPISKANSVEALTMLTIDSTVEDGIYYLNAIATKDDVIGTCLSKAYDIYNSTETIVEYENFKHTDSKYAIRIYWAKFTKQAFSYSAGNFTIQAPTELIDIAGNSVNALDKVDFDEGTDANTLYILRQDKVTLSAGSDSATATSDSNYSGRELGYIAYSWASQDTYDKLQYAHNNGAYYQYIYTYVLPRHSKAYYEAFASKASGNFEMLYKSTNSNMDGLGRSRYMYATDITDGKIAMGYSGNVWSSNNQNLSSKMNMNINTIIDNYNSLANGKVPMLVIMHMAGTTTSSSEARLYEMGFHKTVNS